MFIHTLASIVIGYILGSIPTGYLAARSIKGIDVTQIGSGRTGGSNVLRSAGLVPAIVTVLGDLAKGWGSVALARAIAPDVPLAPVLAGLASVTGHNWPVFLHFRGGVGTMTTFGAAVTLVPIPALFAGAVGAITVAIWRRTSIGSITFAVMLLVASIVSGVTGATAMGNLILTAGTALMSLLQLRPNIERLRRGTERRLGEFVPAGEKDIQRNHS